MTARQLEGDAAALHQAILRRRGAVSPFFCGRELGWNRSRIARAMEDLVSAGILRPERAVLPEPADRHRKYSLPEARQRMEADPAFARTVRTVEQAAGRRLPAADLSALTELYDLHGMSPEALDLLTAQCYEETLSRGEGRPGLKRIEKVGLDWARMGVRTRADAVAAVQLMGLREKTVREVRQRLGLPPELWVASDERYITAWLDWGFSPEVIELAYDRTVLHCGRRNWKYCHGILESWKGKGLFTPEEIQEKDGLGRPEPDPPAAPADDPWDYVK